MKILNKSIAVALIFAMIMSVMSFGVFAAGPGLNLSLVSSAASVVGGNTITITMQGKAAADTIAVGAAAIKIQYDTAKFELVSTDLAYAPFDPANSEAADNHVLLNTFSLGKTFGTTASDIISFNFKAKEGAAALGAAEFTLTEYDGCWGTTNSDDITITASSATVNVIEETTISSVTNVPVEIEYDSDLAAAKALFPSTVKGAGQTTTGSAVSDADIPVVWDFADFTTLPETMDAITVEGALTAGNGIIIADGVKAVANVTYKKTTSGVVAPVEVQVKKKADGAELTSVADIAALAEVAAVTKTTVKSANGVAKEVAIDLSSAAFAAESATTLNTAADSGSVTLVADISGDAVYYDIAGKKANIVVTMVPAEINDCTISVSGSTTNSKPVITVTIPKDGSNIEAGKKVVAQIENNGKTYTAEYTITDEDVAKLANADSLTVKVSGFTEVGGSGESTVSLKGMGFSTGDVVELTVKYDGAALLTSKTSAEGVLSVKVQPTSNPGGTGITPAPTPSTTYVVKVAETENGTASVSATSAASGETVKITTTPAEGYVVKSIAVADALGNAVAVNESSFVMPAANVVVTVAFEKKSEEPVVEPTFTDVPADHWAAEAIKALKDAGAINGKTATEFDPEGSVTRAEFTKMLVSLLGIKNTEGTVKFTDCTADAWFTPFVAAAVESGLVNGLSETEFAPNSTISREDVCTIIGRYLNTKETIGDKELKFNDADDVAEYAANYVAYMAEIGIVNGYSDGSFAPKASITRAEAAKVLYGLSKVVANNDAAEK